MTQQRRIGRPPAADDRDVRNALVDAAIELFGKSGYASTSIQDIATAAGVTKGALYHYFTSKDELLYTIYAPELQNHIALLLEALQMEAPAIDRLRKAASDIVEISATRIHRTAIFFESLSQLSEARQREIRRERRRYHELFASLIKDAREDGSIRAEPSPDIVIDFFFGAVHYLRTWYDIKGPISPTELGEIYADFLIRGLVDDR
ncbi:TetR/AcrR family transcriptional regulator [Nocardioides sp.]|uniref:TetR/AcrR family transcriptional regulator n=1 Tax=Nocardioides sp. TaxID=35761 RepID=UPI0039E4F5A3